MPTYYDQSFYDGLYEVGRPQLQILLSPEETAFLYPLIGDLSIMRHIKQAGSLILTLDNSQLLPAWDQFVTTVGLSVSTYSALLASKDTAQILDMARQQNAPQQTVSQNLIDALIISHLLQPPFRFGYCNFSDDTQILAQFC